MSAGVVYHLTMTVLQNGPFRSAKWAVLHYEMGRFATRFGPFRIMPFANLGYDEADNA